GTTIKSLVNMPRPGERFVVAGNAMGRGGDWRPREVFGAYAITYGCPKVFWDEWMKQVGHDMECVQKELLFAHDKSHDTKVHGKANEDEVSGLEPINPADPYRGRQDSWLKKIRQYDKADAAEAD